jgi:hypothetical protein
MLVLLVVVNASIGIVVWAVPKLQVYFMSVTCSIGCVLLAAEIIWKFGYVQAGVQMAVALVCLLVLACMRKLAARVSTSGPGASGESRPAQLTLAQKIF